MNLTRYVNDLCQHLAVAAEAGGEEAAKLAERLVAALETATRLVLLEALSAAAIESLYLIPRVRSFERYRWMHTWAACSIRANLFARMRN